MLTEQADACAAMGSPMYADLLLRIRDDVADAGPFAAVLAGHEDDPGPSALGLRLLGSVHRLVLERRAGALGVFYPSVGGTWEPEGCWAALRDLAEAEPGTIREWLDHPPQTNEVGRASALYGGLLQLSGDLPVRLREIGSSGGLNLRCDRFGYRDERGTAYGDPDSPLVLAGAWGGRTLTRREVTVTDRLGCDLRPVDVASTAGRLALTAYVWADQTDRFERLRAAFAVADRVPAPVLQQDAREFVAGLDLVEGATTVLMHSVMWQYLSSADRAAILDGLDALGAGATPTRRVAHLRAEPSRRAPGAAHEFLVRLREWPGGEERLLGRTVGHGIPTIWE